ncbi:DsbA family oxidoreductase [Georgenia halophila]|uniref:DsbA family oxidoreductase n=2 Tax=Georgenia halophila TaxID=620889 RepID=A0ABP8LK79_9MICO
MADMSEPISVQVWSDIACPWCYVGKRRFEKGVESFGGDVTLEYRSFELAPDTPVDFEGSEVDFLAGHKGMPRDQVLQMLEQMTTLAAAEGLAYDFDAIRHTKTLKAHEVLHLAKARGVQLDVVEKLFSAYFAEGRHVGRDKDLAELGAQAGLDAEEVRTALAEGTYTEAVQQDIAQARAYGITGVPFFVIDGRYGVSGAQSPEVFAQALAQVANERAGTTAEEAVR